MKSMQAVRLIRQSFISSIKTGSPWDSEPQAAEYPHLVINDGLVCLTLPSPTCTCTQMICPCRASQRAAWICPTVVCLQSRTNSAVGFRFKSSGDLDWKLDIFSSKMYVLSIYTVHTRADYFRHVLFILISCIQGKKKKGTAHSPSLLLFSFLCVDVYREKNLAFIGFCTCYLSCITMPHFVWYNCIDCDSASVYILHSQAPGD